MKQMHNDHNAWAGFLIVEKYSECSAKKFFKAYLHIKDGTDCSVEEYLVIAKNSDEATLKAIIHFWGLIPENGYSMLIMDSNNVREWINWKSKPTDIVIQYLVTCVQVFFRSLHAILISSMNKSGMLQLISEFEKCDFGVIEIQNFGDYHDEG
jgi:hypothetical protein